MNRQREESEALADIRDRLEASDPRLATALTRGLGHGFARRFWCTLTAAMAVTVAVGTLFGARGLAALALLLTLGAPLYVAALTCADPGDPANAPNRRRRSLGGPRSLAQPDGSDAMLPFHAPAPSRLPMTRPGSTWNRPATRWTGG